jgi:ABC-type sugar transport system substrate-binding protein
MYNWDKFHSTEGRQVLSYLWLKGFSMAKLNKSFGVKLAIGILSIGLISTTNVYAATTDPMADTKAFLKGNVKPPKGLKIAYIVECVGQNTFCQAREAGVKKQAKKYGWTVKLYDAGFNPATQLTQVQDAIQQKFDGYVFAPVADATGCQYFKLLKATGKPVVNINSPMCGNKDYTKGTVGFVAMQTTSFFQQHAENAFKSCTSACEVLAVGGYTGSDLFTRWETAIKAAAKKYPKVTVVVDQAGSFDPGAALQVTQDALRAHPNISVAISSWDDMTRGIEQGVTSSGKKPGKDVRIYSVGGTRQGLASVAKGTWNETTVLLPYEESQYGVVQLGRYFATKKTSPGFTYLAKAQVVVDGTNSIFITASNVSKFAAEY